MAYGPILFVGQVNGLAFANIQQFPEEAGQTFKQGVPLVFDSGNVEQAPFPILSKIAGVSVGEGKNLTTAGTTEPAYSQQSVMNQPNAKVIPVGARVKEGLSPVYLADSENLFTASLAIGQTFSPSMVGSTRYALDYDATSGYWYIDTSDSGTDPDHCVRILRKNDAMYSPTTDWVIFQFDPATYTF